MPETIRVHLADAPTDVLVWLTEQPENHWWTVGGVAAAVAPEEADEPLVSTVRAMKLLRDGGLIEGKYVDGDLPVWRATDEGRRLVEEARNA